jgi:hypothetical protein
MRFKKMLALAGALGCLGFIAADALAQPRMEERRERRDERRGPERWVALGCQKVGFRVDRDVIRVGRREGRFKAIRLKAIGNDVHMLDLKVIYANGEPDDIPVRSEIRAGRETGPLDLRGRERSIDRIEMVYRSRPDFRGEATICVEGLD